MAPPTPRERLIVIGAGFAGINLARVVESVRACAAGRRVKAAG